MVSLYEKVISILKYILMFSYLVGFEVLKAVTARCSSLMNRRFVGTLVHTRTTWRCIRKNGNTAYILILKHLFFKMNTILSIQNTFAKISDLCFHRTGRDPYIVQNILKIEREKNGRYRQKHCMIYQYQQSSP
jgi:hypothetical protein